MAVIEIVGGVILLIVSVVIFALTLMQHTHGQGLAGVINGSAYGANNARLTPADQMLAKVTPPQRPARAPQCAAAAFQLWRGGIFCSGGCGHRHPQPV